jgi:hypothetical protein
VPARRPPRARSACELHRPDCPPAPAPAPTLFARCPAPHLHRSIPLRRPQPQLALHGLIQIADRDAGDATPRSEINAIKLIDATHKSDQHARGRDRKLPTTNETSLGYPIGIASCHARHHIPAPIPARPVRLPATACTPTNNRSRLMSTLNDEILRRRTFAIISHPDAGKTTLTEKLLLFGGAIQLAEEVKARVERRRARSDWMAVEYQRGHLRLLGGDELRAPGPRLQPARHAGPPGFQPTGISARTPTAP